METAASEKRKVHAYLTYVKKSSEAGGVFGPITEAARGCVLASLDVKLPAIANICASKSGMRLRLTSQGRVEPLFTYGKLQEVWANHRRLEMIRDIDMLEKSWSKNEHC